MQGTTVALIGLAVLVVVILIVAVYYYSSSGPFTSADEGKDLRCEIDGALYRIEGGKARPYPSMPVFLKHSKDGKFTNDPRVCQKDIPKGEVMK